MDILDKGLCAVPFVKYIFLTAVKVYWFLKMW